MIHIHGYMYMCIVLCFAKNILSPVGKDKYASEVRVTPGIGAVDSRQVMIFSNTPRLEIF